MFGDVKQIGKSVFNDYLSGLNIGQRQVVADDGTTRERPLSLTSFCLLYFYITPQSSGEKSTTFGCLSGLVTRACSTSFSKPPSRHLPWPPHPSAGDACATCAVQTPLTWWRAATVKLQDLTKRDSCEASQTHYSTGLVLIYRCGLYWHHICLQ